MVIQVNDLEGGHYVEPYAGGAGIALFLLYHGFASHAHINDLDPAIHAFWDAAVHHTDDLCRRIETTEVTVEEWERQHRMLDQAVGEIEEGGVASSLDLGFATFFLNRTNRSGILSGGVIGGKEQSGKWKIDARFNSEALSRRIQRIGEYRDRISLYCKDAAVLISDELSQLPSKTLMYLDPPYYQKGQDLYANYYDDSDHADIASLMSEIDQNWIVSYDKVQHVCDLYEDYESIGYSLSYSAQNRYRGSEIMFFSPSTKVPRIDNPVQLTREQMDRYMAAHG